MATDDDEEESDRDRMVTNVIVVVFLVALVGGGLWLANSLATMRKDQDCVLSGRRNCADISVPPRDQ